MQTSILQHLHKQFSEYELNYNTPNENLVMSSVAIVVRVTPKIVLSSVTANDVDGVLHQLKHLEEVHPANSSDSFYDILFLQRALNPQDSNPGHICFPGGKCDNNEPDL